MAEVDREDGRLMSINTFAFVGRLTRDPELKATASGTAVCELSLAVNDRVKNGDQWEDRADFFDIVAYGGQAETAAKFLVKGREVAVAGRVRQDRWLDKQTNNQRSRVRFVARDVQFIGGREDGGQQGQQHDSGQSAWGGQGGGFGQAPTQQSAPGTAHPVEQSDFGGGFGAQTGPATDSDDDIPF